MNTQNNEILDISYFDRLSSAFSRTHFHNSHKIIFVTDGVITIEVGEKSYTVSPNTLVFISNLEKHAVNISKSPYQRYVISLPQDFGSILPDYSPLLSILIQRPANFSHVIKLNTQTADEVHKIINVLTEEYREKRPYWSDCFIMNIVQLLIRLYRFSSDAFPVSEASSAEKIVSDVQQYIIHNSHKDISLELMAQKHFISKYYLSHVFKSVTGYTFKNYLILNRLLNAKDLLLHTNHSVTEVCFRSGFNNVNHFIRIFKEHEGLTPYQYKKRSE